MSRLRKAIVIFNCDLGSLHGVANLEETRENGPVRIKVEIHGLEPGRQHGFHIHKLGNLEHGADSLCEHYNPTNKKHGGLNEDNAHVGDLGNLYVNSKGDINRTFIAKNIRLRGDKNVIGRSMVIHENKDDLGRGNFADSTTTGHSGKRILYGIIGINS